MSVSKVRQVIDIQNQIRNLNADFQTDELHSLLDYNTHIKKYLLENSKEDFIRKHINEIPNFKIEDFKIGFDYIGILVSVFSNRFDSFNGKKYDFEKAKIALNEISDKYAALEQMLENSASL